VKVWDSGPFDLGDKNLFWMREIRLKANAAANLSVAAYMDSVAYPVITGVIMPAPVRMAGLP
jgi:hypothetical protein